MKLSLTRRLLIIFALLYGADTSAITFFPNKLDQTYVFFPFAHIEIRPDVHDDPDLDLEELEVEYGTDIFYLLNYKKFRLLGELALTSEELELERLKIGFDITPTNTLWIGRFHSPLGFWNSNYHHGLHLQTSVHRPGIIEYEENGGVLANHISGALLEGQHFISDGAINYSIAAGYSPNFEHGLEPFSLELENIENKLHSILKIGYQPDDTDPSETGIVLSKSGIYSEDVSLEEIQQQVLGIYTHQSWTKYRITASAYLINNIISYNPTDEVDASFAAGYVHAEYDIASKWIIYARIERAIGGEHDPYLELFEHSETQRNLGGIRFDLTRRQAISSEISKRISDHDSHIHISIQWSAVFP